MFNLFEVFYKPSQFYAKRYGSLSLTTLGIVYVAFFTIFAILAVAASAAAGGDVLTALLTFTLNRLLPFFFFAGVVAVVSKLIIGSKNKQFSFKDGLKVFLTSYVVSNTISIFTEVLSLGLIVASGDFINQATVLENAENVDPGQLQALAGQGIAFGGLGLLLFCVAMIGLLWSAYVMFRGFKVVGKTDTATALITTVLSYLTSLCAGFVIGFIAGALGFATAAAVV